MFVGTIILVVAASSMTLSVGAWVVPPAFCNGIDCPQYKTICNTSGFEIRSYPAAQWVSIDFEGPGTSDFQNAEHDGFKHLFDYITGANALGAKIDMTAPVNDKIVPGSGPNCNTTFTISFFIPFKYQGLAPKPTNPRVYVRDQANLTVAVRSFGGFVIDWSLSIVPEFLALGLALVESGISFSQKQEWVAQYDGPFTIFNRHNEVWYEVDANAQC